MAVIFFDGHCNLCNRFIDYLISRDREHKLKFAPLQGRAAEQRLAPEYREKLGTVVFERNGRVYVRSTAAILAVAELGGIYQLAKVFLIVPKFLRDLVYRYIARNRYLWFGRRDTCRLPNEQERRQFLD